MTLEDKLPNNEAPKKEPKTLYSLPMICGLYVTGMTIASIAYVLYLSTLYK